MNLFLEYLRYPLTALILLCLPPWLVFLAIKAMRRRNWQRAYWLMLFAILLGVPIGRFALNVVVGRLVLTAPPPSEASLIAELQENMGVELPVTAKITSYRTAVSFFGEWGGLLKANIPCQQIGQFKSSLTLLTDRQAHFEVLSQPQGAMLDVWQKSRFTIPTGSHVVETDDGEFQAIYAVDGNSCTIHYQRNLLS